MDQQNDPKIDQPKKKSRNQSKQGSILSIIFILISILLCIALIVTLWSFANYKKNAVIPADVNPEADQTSSEIQEEVVTVEALKEYAQQYNVSIEFLQRFFDDVIVYKDTGGIEYAPIDPDLPKHSYDFNNLVQVDGEIEYHENGVSTGVKGIDVSKHQGDINWKKVKADGVEFALIRLGYRGYETGKIMLDEYYEQNIKEATAAGIEVGVYFFSQAITIEEVNEEADMVLKYIKDYKITYPVVFDYEEMQGDVVRSDVLTTAERTDITIAFCEKIKAAGYNPMIYANIKWFVARLDMRRLAEYDKWFAQYFDAPFFPYDFKIWQYTAKGQVDGIKGDVDMNIAFKDFAV